MTHLWFPGVQVRLRSDPGTVGVCTGVTRARPDGSLNVQVVFAGLGKTFQPDFDLELMPEGPEDPFNLLEQGRFGRAEHLRRCLTHIQLSGKLANLVYSMDTTNTQFYPYQFKPVLTFLESPSSGLLIADEVGLGKTIEAGLIWTELRARFDSRRLVVLCPAMLREKWQIELSQRFGVDAQMLDAGELLNALEKPKDDVSDGRAIICSLQGVRPPRGWADEDRAKELAKSSRLQLASFLRDRADSEPAIDLLIVDEAHYLRNPNSMTNAIGHLLRAVSEHVVLLSATPINLSDLDLFELLNLIDPDTFQYPDSFPDLVKRNAPLIVARDLALLPSSTEEEIKDQLRIVANPFALLRGEQAPSRSVDELLAAPLHERYLSSKEGRVALADRLERLNVFANVISRTRKAEVTEFRTVRRPFTEKVTLSTAEMAFYQATTEAIRTYATTRAVSDGFLLAPPQRQVSSCMVAAVRAWMARDFGREIVYDDLGGDTEEDSPKPLIDSLVNLVLPEVNLSELERNDSKFTRFKGVVTKALSGSTEKIVVFSYFRETLKYLSERLQAEGISAVVLMGGMKESKQTVIDRFRDEPSLKVLLSSEVAAEGVDLQFCRVLINYDLPWNPMRVEQRIGRIDRLGQQADSIVIWNICADGTIDQKILERLYSRLKIFERALGGFEAILGEKIQELTSDLLSSRLTPQEEAIRIEKTATAVATIRQQQEELEAQASNLIAHGGYVLDAVKAAHEFSRRISDVDLLIYVQEYLRRHAIGHTFQKVHGAADQYELKLPADIAARFGEFQRVRRLQGQSRLASGEVCRCRFLNKVQVRTGAVEQISQFHPLVRFIGWELDQLDEALVPLIALRIAVDAMVAPPPAGIYAFAVKRWTFSGLRTEEELRTRAVSVNRRLLGPDVSLNLLNQARALGTDWLGAPGHVETKAIKASLEEALSAVEADYIAESLRRENENFDRIQLQKLNLEQHRKRKLTRLQETLALHKQRGSGLVKATEGQIRKLQERVEVRLQLLEHKGRLSRSQFDVTAGVIELY